MKAKEQVKENLLFLIPAVLVLLLLLLFGRRLSHILISLVLALLIATLMEPTVNLIQRKLGFRRVSAIFCTYLGFFAALVLLLSFLLPAVVHNLESIIASGDRLQAGVDQLLEFCCRPLGEGSSWKEQVRDYLDGALAGVVRSVGDWALSLLDRLDQLILAFFNGVLDVVTGFVVAFYLLKDREQISHWVLSLFPYTWRDTLSHLARDMGKISAQFIQGQFLLAFLVGTLETLGLWVIGVPFPLILGILGGLSNIIPYFGPFLGAIPACAAALLISPSKAIWTALLFLLVQQVDNNFLSPKIIEGKLGIHPVATILVVFVGGEFFGITGILLAIPLYAMLRCLLRRILKNGHHQSPEVAAN